MTSPEYIEYDQGKGRIPPAKAFSRAVSSEFKRLTTQRWFKWALPLMVLAPVLMEWFIAATNAANAMTVAASGARTGATAGTGATAIR